MTNRTLQFSLLLAIIGLVLFLPASAGNHQTITGTAAFADFAEERPGTFRRITLADLPQPFASESVVNYASVISRPTDMRPQAPPGFKVELYADGLSSNRLIRTAPNGDLFLAESRRGEIKVFRGVGKDGKSQRMEIFASSLNWPFGIAFYPPGPDPQWVYVGNTDSVVRFHYRRGDLMAAGQPQIIVPDLPGGGRLAGGGHWTRDIAFSRDGKKMFVSVGSHSNNDDADNNPAELHRADILEYNPDGSGFRVYAYGIRNAVGIAVQPETGQLWGSVNERDELGDNLPPDYITHIQDGGFYGWPWFYMGGNWDPKHKGKHPELKDKVITPDVLLNRTLPPWRCSSTRENNFPPNTKETFSPPSMDRGTARNAAATR